MRMANGCIQVGKITLPEYGTYGKITMPEFQTYIWSDNYARIWDVRVRNLS